jgi:hypothetical protein
VFESLPPGSVQFSPEQCRVLVGASLDKKNSYFFARIHEFFENDAPTNQAGHDL